MPDETQVTTPPDGAQNTDAESSQSTEKPIPYARFKEINDERKALEKKLKDLQRQAEEREQQTLAEQGKYKELFEKQTGELATLKTAHERAVALEAAINANNEKRVARIPETMRSVVPADYTPEKLSEWLDKNEAILTKPAAPTTDAGAQGTPKTPISLTPEERAIAQTYGISDEEYAKFKRK